jgi:hypothetical protein
MNYPAAEQRGIRPLEINVKRNIERFPAEFIFQVVADEFSSLRAQNVTLENQDCLRFQIGSSNNKENLKKGKTT